MLPFVFLLLRLRIIKVKGGGAWTILQSLNYMIITHYVCINAQIYDFMCMFLCFLTQPFDLAKTSVLRRPPSYAHKGRGHASRSPVHEHVRAYSCPTTNYCRWRHYHQFVFLHMYKHFIGGTCKPGTCHAKNRNITYVKHGHSYKMTINEQEMCNHVEFMTERLVQHAWVVGTKLRQILEHTSKQM